MFFKIINIIVSNVLTNKCSCIILNFVKIGNFCERQSILKIDVPNGRLIPQLPNKI